ncbi:NBN [Lepeophtheirus salmonis]|uniref:NBN n=1 Tax=Lepeophtheirus salmonis TaxID=72036 RepID=A0A7R8CK12_LEPSM|nr:NBN [Lepeophtheirus salmonis]CAF2846266.1 NBN [Lepeophtheirus salmonis]
MWIFTRDPKFQSEEDASVVSYALLAGKTYVLGRAPSNEIQISDASVSRKHASLVVSEKSIAVKDQKSAYGTYVGESAIASKGYIIHSARIRIRFGLHSSIWILQRYEEPKIISSALTRADKRALTKLMDNLFHRNDVLVDEMCDEVSYLVMRNVVLTVKACYTSGQVLPDPNNYIPQLKESSINSESVCLKPNATRSYLFKGKSFFFDNEDQMLRFKNTITYAGGKTLVSNREHEGPNKIFIKSDKASSIQSDTCTPETLAPETQFNAREAKSKDINSGSSKESQSSSSLKHTGSENVQRSNNIIFSDSISSQTNVSVDIVSNEVKTRIPPTLSGNNSKASMLTTSSQSEETQFNSSAKREDDDDDDLFSFASTKKSEKRSLITNVVGSDDDEEDLFAFQPSQRVSSQQSLSQKRKRSFSKEIKISEDVSATPKKSKIIEEVSENKENFTSVYPKLAVVDSEGFISKSVTKSSNKSIDDDLSKSYMLMEITDLVREDISRPSSLHSSSKNGYNYKGPNFKKFKSKYRNSSNIVTKRITDLCKPEELTSRTQDFSRLDDFLDENQPRNQVSQESEDFWSFENNKSTSATSRKVPTSSKQSTIKSFFK